MEKQSHLWDLSPSSLPAPDIRDSTGAGVRSEISAAEKVPFTWKLPVTASVALALGATVLAVGAYVFRQSPPDVVHVPVETAPVGEESAQGGVVFVHVVGAVERPGLVEVPAESRVLDAIEKAGGASDNAALEGVNLARIVFDGEQIVVPVVGEADTVSGTSGSGLISLSSADLETLDTLPRIGPATAARIISWREENGPFRSIEDLLAISGIGEATLEGLRPLVTP